MNSRREAYFDNIRFFLVVFVVLGHMALGPIMHNSEIANALYTFIYFFHMPLFIFLSGYFSKNIHKEDYSDKIFSKIIVPYLIFQTMFLIFHHYIYDTQSVNFVYFTPYYALWFLVALAVWKLLLPHIVKIKHVLPISILIAVLVGYINDAGTYFSISRIVVFFPMFLMGYYFEKKHLDIFFKKSTRIVAFMLLVITVLTIYFYGQGIKKQLLFGGHSYESMGIDVWYAGVLRLLVIVASVVISFAFMAIVPRRKLFLVSDMGTRTMYVFILHAFAVKYLHSINFYAPIDTAIEKVLWVAACIVFSMILASKPVRFIFKPLVEPRLDYIFKSNIRKTEQ